jgi:hypothetical protein
MNFWFTILIIYVKELDNTNKPLSHFDERICVIFRFLLLPLFFFLCSFSFFFPAGSTLLFLFLFLRRTSETFSAFKKHTVRTKRKEREKKRQIIFISKRTEKISQITKTTRETEPLPLFSSSVILFFFYFFFPPLLTLNLNSMMSPSHTTYSRPF